LQALGIAVTSYIASLSNGGPAWSNRGVWAQHGYLITFEGLLSAVGKELGMIEGEHHPFYYIILSSYSQNAHQHIFSDASVAISMLRIVSVVLVSDDANSSPPPDQQRIPVLYSPFV
jgi:hypothetical protein